MRRPLLTLKTSEKTEESLVVLRREINEIK
jgi:hypothetical protein